MQLVLSKYILKKFNGIENISNDSSLKILDRF